MINFKETQNQLLVILCGNVASINTGLLLGWIAPTIAVLRSPASPLPSGPITTIQQSWIGAAELFGLFIGIFIFSAIAKKFGRKVAIILIGLPTIIGLLLLIYQKSVIVFVACRLICGLSIGGTFFSIPMMVTEISDDHIRGTFGSILTIFQYSGILIGNIIGTYVSLTVAPLILLTTPVLLVVCFICVPESPVYLYNTNKTEAGDASLKFYKNCSSNVEKFMTERDKIFLMLYKFKDEEKRIGLADLCNTSTIKGLLIGLVLSILNTCTGVVVLSTFAPIVFLDSGSTLNPNESTMTMATIQLVGAIVAAILCDRIGRKILLCVSLMGCAIGQSTMGIFVYLGLLGFNISTWSWTSIASLSLILFSCSIGIGPLRHIVGLEVVPTNLRTVATISYNVATCVSQIMLFMFFPILSEQYGLHATMWCLSVICTLGVIFCALAIDETKGKNINT